MEFRRLCKKINVIRTFAISLPVGKRRFKRNGFERPENVFAVDLDPNGFSRKFLGKGFFDPVGRTDVFSVDFENDVAFFDSGFFRGRSGSDRRGTVFSSYEGSRYLGNSHFSGVFGRKLNVTDTEESPLDDSSLNNRIDDSTNDFFG